MEKPQAGRHGASPESRFGDVREAGRRGAEARERNWHDRVTLHREELEKHASTAIAEIGAILDSGASAANKLKAAQLILDRIGLGPHSFTEVTDGTQLLEQWIAEIEAMDENAGH